MTTVRAVVVNWNSWWFTRRCLASLLAADASFGELDVVVVDNGSVDGSLERLRHEFDSSVRFVDNGRNLGFAEACNRGMGDLTGVDHVALVNNDAMVEPNCLVELVDVLMSRPDAGAAAARMVLEPLFATVSLDVRGRCTLERVEVDGVDATTRVHSGDLILTGRPEWPLELRREAEGSLRLLVPAAAGQRITLTVSGQGSMVASTAVGAAEARLGPNPQTVELATDLERVELLNGLGTDRDANLESFDRHFGAFADPAVVPELAGGPTRVTGFCGGGVLLRARMLEEVGRFDPRFFAYYEDSDLARRAEGAGWLTVTAPSAVVRHAFGGSGGARAPGFFFLNYRNWLLTTLRDPTPEERRLVRSAVVERLHIAVRSNVLSRLRRRRLPSFVLTFAWLRVLAGFAVARLVDGLDRSGPPGRRPTSLVRLPPQPRFAARPPSARPGGPVMVRLQLEASSGWRDGAIEDDPLLRQLLVPPAEVADRLEIVPVVATDDAVRAATPVEVGRVLGERSRDRRHLTPIVLDRAAPRTVSVKVDARGWSATMLNRPDGAVHRFDWSFVRSRDAPEVLGDDELEWFVDTVSSLVTPG